MNPTPSGRSVYRMGVIHDCRDSYKTMVPITTAAAKKHLHSFPTQSLTDAYIQTAALEIFHARTVYDTQTIAG